MDREIDRYKPDVVVVCYAWNDTDTHTQPDKETLPTDGLHVWQRRLMAWSQTIMHAVRWVKKSREEDPSTDESSPAGARRTPHLGVERVSMEDYLENFRLIAQLARSKGARPVFIAPIYRDAVTYTPQAARIARYRKALRQLAEDEGIPYLHIEELTEAAHPENASLFGDLIHPNHIGHRLMADRLLELMHEEGMPGSPEPGKVGMR